MGDFEYMPLGLRVLDEQLVDSEGRRCGRVEDLELDGGPGRPSGVVAILCGGTAWKRRLPESIAQLFPGDPRGLRRVPWGEVAAADNEIELRCTENELGQAHGTEPAPCTLSKLLGTTVCINDRARLGRIWEVIACRPQSDDPRQGWRIYGVLLGRRALLQRVGFTTNFMEDLRSGDDPENLLKWDVLSHFSQDGHLVAGRVGD